MVTAAKLAKQHDFDYISYKPFLTRSEQNNAEIVGIDKQQESVATTMRRIRDAIVQAKQLEDGKFSVIESTNLRVLENGTYMDYSKQPHNCHMQYFRQVYSVRWACSTARYTAMYRKPCWEASILMPHKMDYRPHKGTH